MRRIPSVSSQTLRVRLDLDAADKFSLGVDLLASSASRLRGDENKQDAHGQVACYALLNLDGRWRVANQVEVSARVNDVFDRRCANFVVLGNNVFARHTAFRAVGNRRRSACRCCRACRRG